MVVKVGWIEKEERVAVKVILRKKLIERGKEKQESLVVKSGVVLSGHGCHQPHVGFEHLRCG